MFLQAYLPKLGFSVDLGECHQSSKDNIFVGFSCDGEEGLPREG